jgi:hypothetical protein
MIMRAAVDLEGFLGGRFSFTEGLLWPVHADAVIWSESPRHVSRASSCADRDVGQGGWRRAPPTPGLSGRSGCGICGMADGRTCIARKLPHGTPWITALYRGGYLAPSAELGAQQPLTRCHRRRTPLLGPTPAPESPRKRDVGAPANAWTSRWSHGPGLNH